MKLNLQNVYNPLVALTLKRIINIAIISSFLAACGGGDSAPDEKVVNKAPRANAGPDQSVDENKLVTLTGSGTDSDGTISTYSWAQTSGVSVTLSNANSASATFTTPFVTSDDTLIFQLTITDNDGATAVSNTTIQLSNAAPITLSGMVYSEIIEGAAIVLMDKSNNQIAQATSNELGQYSVTFENDQTGDTCYNLSATGGMIEGTDFIETLTATYCGEFVAVDEINITPVTTLIDVLATNLQSDDVFLSNREAKQQLTNLGILAEGNEWNKLGSEVINYGMLSLEVKAAGSVTAWINDVIADMIDLQLLPTRVSYVFKHAHGGIEKILTANVSLFAGQSRNINVTPLLSDDSLPLPTTYSLLDAPEWITMEGDLLKIAPGNDVSAGQYRYQISAAPENGSQNRINTFDMEILRTVTLLEGTLDSSGGDIRNQFQDIVLSVPADALSQSYNLQYRASIDEKGAFITNLTSKPEMPANEMAQLTLAAPSSEVLIQNYLQEFLDIPQVHAQKRLSNNLEADEENTNSDYDSSRCYEILGDSWQDRNRDGFSFDHIWSCQDANFVDNVSGFFTEWGINKVGGIPFTYSNLLSVSDYNIRENRAFVLRSNSALESITRENSKIPVLFIHGFKNNGTLGGFDNDEFLIDNSKDISGEYFGAFPRLVNEYTAKNESEFSPFLFQWRTNVPFEVAAHHLGIAIEKITQVTGKKVHIVAHSFGGILSRTLVQGLAQNKLTRSGTTYDQTFVENNIASLTTVGTPHSGIFPNDEESDYDSLILQFPDGTSGISGTFVRICEAITCHQMGANTQGLIDLRSELCGGECPVENGKDKWFGMHEEKGTIVHHLRTKLYPASPGWPSIETQVLIGLIGDGDVFPKYVVDRIKGDGLISLAGQRFDAAGDSASDTYKNLLSRGNYQRFVGSSYIDEHFLGFQEFNETFTSGSDSNTDLFRSFTDYYLADIKGDGLLNRANQVDLDAPESEFMTKKRTVDGYDHRTGQYTKIFEFGYDKASEVGIQECNEKMPEDCRHNTWQYFTSFMSQLNLGETVDAPQQISLTGRIGNLDTITGTVSVSVVIDDSLVAIFFLEGGNITSFQNDVPFVPNAEYEIIFSPPLDSGFRAKTLILKTQSTLNASSLALGQTILFNTVFQEGTITLEVVDAISGSNIPEFQVIISNNAGNIFYKDEDPLTDGFQLVEGDYTFSISSGDYITKSKQCSATSAESTLCRIELVGPVGEDDIGKLTAILSWQVDPRDLDTHLVKYDLSGNQQYHIYYGNKNDRATGDNLDRDDTSSYGPETVTIQNVDDESIYVYYVYDFAGSGSITTTSFAQVDVTNFFSATEPFQAAYQAPTNGEGRYWKVFEVRNGIVEPCRTDCIMDSRPRLSAKPEVENSDPKKGAQTVPIEIFQSISFN